MSQGNESLVRPEKPGKGRPNFERLTQIVIDHAFYAERYPDKLQEIADRLGCSTIAAMAVAIADQITEEFTLTERVD